LWRGGCIIRAQFLERIMEAFAAEPNLENLLLPMLNPAKLCP
jgi:6-phosphogluconate dehydrogenase